MIARGCLYCRQSVHLLVLLKEVPAYLAEVQIEKLLQRQAWRRYRCHRLLVCTVVVSRLFSKALEQLVLVVCYLIQLVF